MASVEDLADAVAAGDDRLSPTIGIDALARQAQILADADPAIGRGWIRRPATIARRASRKAVDWYVAPTLVHVSDFNLGVVQVFTSLRSRIRRLETEARRIDELEARLAALEHAARIGEAD